jgi:hypothetical protein
VVSGPCRLLIKPDLKSGLLDLNDQALMRRAAHIAAKAESAWQNNIAVKPYILTEKQKNSCHV